MNKYDAGAAALLVWKGYTISDAELAALGRVGPHFVMRDVHGRRRAIAVEGTTLADLVEAWRLFREIAGRMRGHRETCRTVEVTGPVLTEVTVG